MTIVAMPNLSDRLHRLSRMQQFQDHDARLRPTQDELLQRRQQRQREALNLKPPFLGPWPPRVA